MLRTEVIDHVEGLNRYRDPWDELAVSASQPFGAPAWMIAWWRHVAPRATALRTIVAFDGGELVALAPLFVERGILGSRQYRLLGAGCSSRVDLLARPGEEERAAPAIATRLAAMSPSPDVILFEGVPHDSPWPRLLSIAWPAGRPPTARRAFSLPTPVVTLDGLNYDHWYAGKSKNFRQGFRRKRRQLDAIGARFSLLTEEAQLSDELADFARLHHARWEPRGGSRVLTGPVEQMLNQVAGELLSDLRFKLWSIRLDGRSISSHILLSAGSRTTYWLGGFDDHWARYHPAMLTLLAALQHDFATDSATFDLGTGDQPYKARLADAREQVDWVAVVPRARFVPVAELAFVPRRLRIEAARRLPRRAKEVARTALRGVAIVRR